VEHVVFTKNIILKLLLRLLHLLFAEKIYNLIFLRNKYLFGMSCVSSKITKLHIIHKRSF